jgi:hypothetical protein
MRLHILLHSNIFHTILHKGTNTAFHLNNSSKRLFTFIVVFPRKISEYYIVNSKQFGRSFCECNPFTRAAEQRSNSQQDAVNSQLQESPILRILSTVVANILCIIFHAMYMYFIVVTYPSSLANNVWCWHFCIGYPLAPTWLTWYTHHTHTYARIHTHTHTDTHSFTHSLTPWNFYTNHTTPTLCKPPRNALPQVVHLPEMHSLCFKSSQVNINLFHTFGKLICFVFCWFIFTKMPWS